MAQALVSSANILDVSFSGSTVKIAGTIIKDFVDNRNPVEFQDVDVSNVEWSCNGRMIRTIKPAGIMMSVTVIPGSKSDIALRKLFKESFSNGGAGADTAKANEAITANIVLANAGNSGETYDFADGTIIAGPAGPSVSGNGKMGGNTYTFMFETLK